MLIEIATRKAFIMPVQMSFTFQNVMDRFERLVFNGPPESTREHVYGAAKALREGDWRTCSKLLLSLRRVWSLLPDFDSTKDLLVEKIKESALQTYIFANSSQYGPSACKTL